MNNLETNCDKYEAPIMKVLKKRGRKKLDPEATKICNICGKTKMYKEYHYGFNKCKECRATLDSVRHGMEYKKKTSLKDVNIIPKLERVETYDDSTDIEISKAMDYNDIANFYNLVG